MPRLDSESTLHFVPKWCGYLPLPGMRPARLGPLTQRAGRLSARMRITHMIDASLGVFGGRSVVGKWGTVFRVAVTAGLQAKTTFLLPHPSRAPFHSSVFVSLSQPPLATLRDALLGCERALRARASQLVVVVGRRNCPFPLRFHSPSNSPPPPSAQCPGPIVHLCMCACVCVRVHVRVWAPRGMGDGWWCGGRRWTYGRPAPG